MDESNRLPNKRGGKTARLVVVLVVLVAVFLIGRMTGPDPESTAHDHENLLASQASESTVYTCSMHPQVRLSDPDAKCPICAMDLIPVKEESGGSLGPRMMRMSEEALKLAEIQTQKVVRRFVEMEIPLVGKVDYDERRVKTISAWMPGRLERLFVDYTGVPVKKGEHLVQIYSPDLYATQEELIQAQKATREIDQSDSELIKETARATEKAAREKLELLGLTAGQIAQIETRGSPSAIVEIKAPIGGIVIDKHVREGMYVTTGMPIYTVADLSRLWVRLDAYESDLPWIRYGQEVEIRTEAYGDRVFPGWISFIDPVLDPKTRTVKVRVVVDNPEGALRPNMFARAVVKARAAGEGRLLSRNLKDRYICPMHPEVNRGEPDVCDVCGMDLAPAESLGYVSPEETEPPLVVPASAVLITGKRALVYVRVPDSEEPVFEGVEVSLGPRASDDYIIRSGLAEGQEVVVNGNFKIDSALQLLAKPSMMNPGDSDEGAEGSGELDELMALEGPALEVPEAFRAALADLFASYLEIQQALGGDDPDRAAAMSQKMANQVDAVDAGGLSEQAGKVWGDLAVDLQRSTQALSQADGIQKQREQFVFISRAVEAAARRFGPLPNHAVRRFYCPMAFNNKGAYWLQEDETVLNPYFGATMLRCGEMTELVAAPSEDAGAAHDR